MIKLSVIIPSYKDPLLQKTVDSLLQNSRLPRDEFEIVIVLDGHWPKEYDWSDKRIKVVHLGTTGGMRNAINKGVAASSGEFIMRTDEHCSFDEGYDVKLTAKLEDNWIVYPKRYYLNPVTWTVMDKEPNVYNKLIIDTSKPKFSGVDWRSRNEERSAPEFDIDESMAMQGSCWVMRRSWWDKVIVALQTDGWGPHYGDSVEMCFKTWQAGGKLMVNKTTWHAHKHRDFPRTHNLSSDEARPGWVYALDLWGPYYESEIRPRFGV